MNFDNSRTRSIVFRLVCIVIILAGFRLFWVRSKPADAEYLRQMQTLSSDFARLEESGQRALANQSPGRSVDDLLLELTRVFEQKSDYIRSLQALNPPKKYEEFHRTLVEWRLKEHENEGQLLAGYREYSKARSKGTETTLESLTKANDEIGKKYEAMLTEIVKKNGSESIDKFLAPLPDSK